MTKRRQGSLYPEYNCSECNYKGNKIIKKLDAYICPNCKTIIKPIEYVKNKRNDKVQSQ